MSSSTASSSPAKPPSPSQPKPNYFATALVVICGVIASVFILRLPVLSSPWQQGYNPTGHWLLSTLVAAIPIVVLAGNARPGPRQGALCGACRINGRFDYGDGWISHACAVWRRPRRSTVRDTDCFRSAGSFSTSSSCTSCRLRPGDSRVLQHSLTGITQGSPVAIAAHRLLFWCVL